MPTDKYMDISGISYVNKDFNSVYSELLDLVSTLTNKWDPSISNESDPGVVLIKLGALLTDKNQYNLDKNILELFPQSVSQYGNARKIYDLAGYSMKWYQSATTTLNLTYTGSDAIYSSTNADSSIVMKPLSTMVTNDAGDIVYTLLDPVVMNTSQRTASCECIQGVIKDYEVNGVNTITLDNLDANNRIYFDESLIAENGIFIANNTGDADSLNYIGEWERVDNLESRALDSKVFKFGVLPNSDTCYIQFPQDIANLIEGGLKIKYIVTSGESGNISSNVLTNFYSSEIYVNKYDSTTGEYESVNVTDDISITNPYSAINGADYEDLESAYNNYKSIVGTFNTLVTCKDYETAINNVIDGRNYAASNSVVSDRTNDIVDTTYVVTRNEMGSSPVLATGDMDAFSIGLYVLSPMNTIVNAYYYNKSFSVNTNMDYIENNETYGIKSYKSVQHDYINTTPSNPSREYVYKNCYKLTGTVSTYYKVSDTDAKEIENNIRTALYTRFNARNIDFGVAPVYDDIVSTIQNADSRIKYVMLNQPQYVVKVMYSNDTEGSVANATLLTSAQKVQLLCKMILAGNIQLFNFDKSFDIDFGQTSAAIYPSDPDNKGLRVSAITTSTEISPDTSGNINYTLKENENIQLYTTNFVPSISYTAYVNYRYSTSGSTALTIPANQYRVLGPSETLYINYVDSNNLVVNKYYRAGSIIRPSIDLTTDSSSYTIDKTTDDGTVSFAMLSANESIDIMTDNSTVFNNTLSCLWFTNNSSIVSSGQGDSTTVVYTLFPNPTEDEIAAGQQSRILQNNEYFLYTNANKNELVILTSGTRLVRALTDTTTNSAVQCQNLLNVGDITSNGQSAISENDWYTWVPAVNGVLTAQELSIVTLGYGTSVQGTVDQVSGSYPDITNTPVVINNPKYKTQADDSWISLPVVTLGESSSVDCNWYAVSRLNISASQTTPQQLLSGQSLTYFYTEGDAEQSQTINGPCYIMFNTPLNISGGEHTDVTTLYSDGTQAATVQIYQYTPSSSYTQTRDVDGNIVLIPSTSETSVTLPFSFIGSSSYYLIPVIKMASSNALSITGTGVNVYNYSGGVLSECTTAFSEVTNAGTYYVLVPGTNNANATAITVQWSNSSGIDTSDSLIIGNIYKIDNIDAAYSDVVVATLASIGDDASTSELMAQLSAICTSTSLLFDYTYEVQSYDELDFTVVAGTANENNALAPEMLWDVNHICNKFTIAQMDVRDSSITVASSSRG